MAAVHREGATGGILNIRIGRQGPTSTSVPAAIALASISVPELGPSRISRCESYRRPG